MTNEEAIKLIDDRMCFGRGKWSEHHRPVIDEYWQAGEMAIKALEVEPHWIPVTENCDCDLMDNEEVLVFQKDGTINGQIRHAMFYDYGDKKTFVTWEEGITIYGVAAYMPLPEPYKGVMK